MYTKRIYISAIITVFENFLKSLILDYCKRSELHLHSTYRIFCELCQKINSYIFNRKNHWDILDFSWIAHEWWAKHLSWMPFRRCGNDYFVRGYFLSNRNTVIEHAVGNSVTTVVTTHSDIADVTLLKRYICVLWPMMQDSCGVKCVTTIPIESSHLQLDIDTENWRENSDRFPKVSRHRALRE